MGIVVAAAVAFLRQPPGARNVLWAEDGGIFLQQALQPGGVNVLTPYEGYLHLLPRLAAMLTVNSAPPIAYALTMNLLSCLALGGIAAMVFHCTKQLDGRLHVRLAFASVLVLISVGPIETTGNFANLHWYFLFLTPWLLLKRAETKSEAVLLFLIGAVTSLTEILAALFVPLAFVQGKDRGYWPARFGVVLGLMTQLIATLTSPRTQNTAEPLSLGSIITGWFVNGSGAVVYGAGRDLGAAVGSFGWVPLACASLPFFGAFMFVMWKGRPRHRLMAAVLLGGSMSVWMAIQVVNPARFFDYTNFTEEIWRQDFPSRYAVITSMFVLALLPLVLAVLPQSSRAARTGVAATFIILQFATFFPAESVRLHGPNWGGSIREASEVCRSERIDARVDLPISPTGWFADRVSIPCSKLEGL
jgi:hypothetical protein